MLEQSVYLGNVEIRNSNEANWLLVYDNTRRLTHLNDSAAASYADKFGTRPDGIKL